MATAVHSEAMLLDAQLLLLLLQAQLLPLFIHAMLLLHSPLFVLLLLALSVAMHGGAPATVEL